MILELYLNEASGNYVTDLTEPLSAVICDTFIANYFKDRPNLPQVLYIEAHANRPESWAIGKYDWFKVETTGSHWGTRYVRACFGAHSLYQHANNLWETEFAKEKTIFVRLHTVRPKITES